MSPSLSTWRSAAPRGDPRSEPTASFMASCFACSVDAVFSAAATSAASVGTRSRSRRHWTRFSGVSSVARNASTPAADDGASDRRTAQGSDIS